LTLTLKEIADQIGGQIVGDEGTIVRGINSLQEASRGEIAFFSDPRYEKFIEKTCASALLVPYVIKHYQGAQIVVPRPALAYARVAGLFAPPVSSSPGISPRAFIHEKSRLGGEVTVYPLVYIGEEAIIGDETVLFPGVFIGERVRVGSRTTIYPNVTIMRDCVIGNDVTIHAGSVIGSDGFGFVRDGAENIKVPQIGIVQIDDHVEIGANSTIDRAAMGKTWIKKGVKTDNQVQVAHNVVIDEGTIIVAQSAIGGSARIGRDVVMGGQVAISDHVEVGDGAMIGSQSGVPKSVGPGEVVSGSPSMPHRLWLKTSGIITRLPQILERLRKIEKKVRDLESLMEMKGMDVPDRHREKATISPNREDKKSSP
jgi:UDP-3-O-[3-hydroxymyristoyl] glucosamine N-acyltransferase